MDIRKMNVENVFIWVKLFEFDIKFCGYNSLMKIVGIIGKLIKVDIVIFEKELLSFVLGNGGSIC